VVYDINFKSPERLLTSSLMNAELLLCYSKEKSIEIVKVSLGLWASLT